VKNILVVDDDEPGLAAVERILEAESFETKSALKANVATSAIPIVAYTAYDDKWTEAEARAAGCDGYLVKPITGRMLADVLRKTVEKTG
jgi:CheY-like chemotaxis protein